MTETTERNTGFYWVKHNKTWKIAHYTYGTGVWTLQERPGVYFSDLDMTMIEEKQLEHPDKPGIQLENIYLEIGDYVQSAHAISTGEGTYPAGTKFRFDKLEKSSSRWKPDDHWLVLTSHYGQVKTTAHEFWLSFNLSV